MTADDAVERPSRAVSIGLWGTCMATAGLWLVATPFLRRFSGAPYVSSSENARHAILKHVEALRAAQGCALRLTDLGSGSGEIVLGAAARGYRARGVELNPWLILISRLRAMRGTGNVRKAEFRRQCLWKTSVANEDVIVCFGVPGIMARLAVKLERECKHGAWVCSNTFKLPGWQPVRSCAGVHFYCVVKNETGADVKPTV